MSNTDELADRASIEMNENKNFLVSAPQNSAKAMEKINAITKVVDGAVRLALQRTSSQDWVKMGEKYYPQASAVEKVRSIFGIYYRDITVVREDLPNGDYAYICTGKAGSKLLDSLYGETVIEIEGSRSSNDPFFTGKDGNKQVDPMDIRKSAYANFQVRAAKALLGIGNYNEQDLTSFGVKLTQVAAVNYQQGGEGGGHPSMISAAQHGRLMAICRKNNVLESTLKDFLVKTHKITNPVQIPRNKYDEICRWAENGGQAGPTDRTPGQEG